jgi:hypothetical protein
VGQTIAISDHAQVGDVLMISADRSFSGQDGEAYAAKPDNPNTFPGQLAARLFEADGAIDHVYVMSNTVALRRSGGWDDAALASATETITNFFRFYTPTDSAPASGDGDSTP